MNEPNPKQQVITFWILWIAMFSAIFAYQFALGGGIPEGEDSEEPLNRFLDVFSGTGTISFTEKTQPEYLFRTLLPQCVSIMARLP